MFTEAQWRTILLPLVFVFGASFAMATTTVSVVDIVVLLLAVIVLLKSLNDWDYHWLFVRRHYFLFGFVFLVVLSSLFLPFDSVLFSITTLYLIGLFFLARYLTRSSFQKTIISGYIFGAAVVSSIGVTLALFLSAHELRTLSFFTGERYTFIFSDPNVLGAFLVPALLFAFVHMLYAKERIIFLQNAVLTIVILAAIVLTGSRGAHIQTFVALPVLMCLEFKMVRLRKTQLLQTLTALVVLFSLYFAFTDATFSIPERYTASDLPRLENLTFARELLAERDIRTLFIGSGNGSYEHFSPNGFSAHNTYLRLIVENGIIGVALLVTFIGACIRAAFRQKNRSATASVILASVVGILLHSLFIDTLHWRHFWLLLGLL